MKKVITVFAASILLFSCFPPGAGAANNSAVYAEVAMQNGKKERISPNGSVFYLPSAADITKISLSTGDALGAERRV